MTTIELRVSNFGSEGLFEQLVALLDEQLPPADQRAELGPTEDELVDLQTLCLQGAELASSHGLLLRGAVTLHGDASGKAVAVAVTDSERSMGQNLDPAARAKCVAARAAAAKAAAKKIVAPAPAPPPPVKASPPSFLGSRAAAPNAPQNPPAQFGPDMTPALGASAEKPASKPERASRPIPGRDK
jgi:hypothetical protein